MTPAKSSLTLCQETSPGTEWRLDTPPLIRKCLWKTLDTMWVIVQYTLKWTDLFVLRPERKSRIYVSNNNTERVKWILQKLCLKGYLKTNHKTSVYTTHYNPTLNLPGLNDFKSMDRVFWARDRNTKIFRKI